MRKLGSQVLALVLCSVFAVGCSGDVAPALLSPEPAPLPGGLADEAGNRGFFANATGGLDAVDLETGKLLWQTPAADRPLLLDGEKLVAQTRPARDQVQVILLDCARQGQPVLLSDPIAFLTPKDTEVARQILFEANGKMESGRLRLQWEGSFWFRNDQQQNSIGYRPGAALVNLQSGAVDRLAKEALGGRGKCVDQAAEAAQIAAKPYDLPAADIAALKLPAKFDPPMGFPNGNGVGYRPLLRSWVTRDVVGLLIDESIGDGHTLLLLRWDRKTGRYLGTDRLKTASSMAGGVPRPVLCGNGRYLLFYPSLLNTPPDIGGGGEAASDSPVEVYAVDQGRWAATVTLEAGAKDPQVAGPRLFYVTEGAAQGPPETQVVPRTLKTVDIASQKVLWQRPIESREIPAWWPR